MSWDLFLANASNSNTFVKPPAKGKTKTYRTNDEGAEEKYCYHCNEWVRSSFFNKDKYSSDGLVSYCKTCTREYNREHRAKQKETI